MRNLAESSISRRGFLKTTAAVGGGAMLGGAALAATPRAMAEGQIDEQIFIAGDQYSGCESCQTEVIVRDGKIVGNRRWMDDPRGNRPCLKGLCKFQRLYTDKRIKYPMRRVGERGKIGRAHV